MTQRRLRLLLAEGSHGEAAAALHELYAGSDPGLDLTVVSTIATLLPTIKVVDPEVILLDLGLNLREPMDAVHLVLRTALERNTLTGLTDLLRDQVTGLYTRDGFLTVGARRHEEAMRGGSSLVLIGVRFDNLQVLREAFGPGTANRALGDVAGLLKGCCRRSDVVGRLGEAQFAILGVDAVAPSAHVMRSRLEQHLAVHNQTRSPWGPIDLRTSIGSWIPQDAGTFAEFLDGIESRLRLDVAEMKS